MRKVLLLLLLAAPLEAATEYALTIETTGRLGQGTRRATVLVDGANWCRRANGVTELLSNDGGKTIIQLDHQLKTWWVVDPKLGAVRALQAMPITTNVKVRKLKVKASDEPSDETFAGLPVRKYTVIATYELAGEIGGTPLTSKHGINISLWTNDTLRGSMVVPPVDLATGVEAVDAQLASNVGRIPGFPLKTQLVATRAYAGGMPQVVITTVTVDDIRTVNPPPGAFERPRDYVNQAPVITAPGVAQ